MTVKDLVKELSLEVLSLPDGDREISDGYVGDLLSWVMGKAKEGDCWITIMSNVNVIAVALLRDVACVVLTENAEVDETLIKKATEEKINLFRTEKNSFEISLALGKLLQK